MSNQTCPEQGEHWITDKSGQHMYKCPKCGGAKGHWISDNGWTATRKPCKACSGFVTDSGTGRVTNLPTEPFGDFDTADDKPHAPLLENHIDDVHEMVSAPQPSEAEGKPVPAPNPPIPDELIDILIDHHVDFKMLDQLYEAITRLYAGREARAFAQGQIRELTWAAGTHPDNKTMADRLAELLAKEKLL